MLPQKVVAGINRKEDSAFVWIYETYFTRILNAVRRISRDPSEAHDLTQDVFLALLEHSEPFESLRKIYQYLYRAAVFQSEDHRKHLGV